MSSVLNIQLFVQPDHIVVSPDEYPFTDPAELPEPVLKGVELPKILYPNNINANKSILSFYTRSIVPRITTQATLALAAAKRAKGISGDDEYEDDGNYGSTAVLDVEVLGAISKRVHYGVYLHSPPEPSTEPGLAHTHIPPSGKFVSESKFRADPGAFVPHILNPNRAALDALITKPEVERKLLQRLRKKAEVYALNFSPEGEPSGDAGRKIDVDAIVELYEHYIIPLTKEVEVRLSVPYRGAVLRPRDRLTIYW